MSYSVSTMDRVISVLMSVAIFTAAGANLSAQVYDPNSGIQYRRGQPVVPAFEGWQPNTDGTYSFWFGYLNRNYEEEVDIPVGAANSFDSGHSDEGQPAHFLTRRNMFVFKVVIPKDWPRDKVLIWTLTSHGQTLKAQASLNPSWEVNNGVISENRGNGTFDPSNEAPTITGSNSAVVTFPNVLTLTASVMDDGRPKPKPLRRRGVDKGDELTGIPSIIPESMTRPAGVDIRWVQYRGPALVTFDPIKSRPVYGERVTSTTRASFSAPGDYWVRAIASDGALESFLDIKITVKLNSDK
jgi:hypothetical protein